MPDTIDGSSPADGGRPLLILGAPGVGKTHRALGLARQQSSAPVVRRSARRLGALPASGVLIIDDAHALSDADADAIEPLLIGAELTLVLAGRPGPWMRSGLRRLRRTGLLVEMTVDPLGRAAARDLVRATAAPRRVEEDSVDRLLDVCGGNPLMLIETVRSLLRTGAMTDVLGYHVWHGAQPARRDLVEIGDVVMAGLDDATVRAAEVLAIARALPAEILGEIAGRDATDDLRSTGLLSASGDGLAYRDEMTAAAVAARTDAERQHSLAPRIAAVLDSRAAEPRQWSDEQARAFIRLCLEHTVPVPLPLLRHARVAQRASGDPDVVVTLAAGVIEHPHTTPSEKLGAYADRIDADRGAGELRRAHADLAAGAALIGVADAAARTQFATAGARLLQYVDDDADQAHRLIADELARIGPGPEHDALLVQQAVLSGFGGPVRAASTALADVLTRTSGATRLPAVAPAVMIAAQQGSTRIGRTLAERAFPLALLHARTHPWAPGEIVVASYFIDIVTGRLAQATRTQRRIESVLRRSRRDLPPHDIALSRVGGAILAMAGGAWSDAAETLADVVVRYDRRDPYGQRPFVHAHFALASAASGATATARDGIAAVRSALGGTSRIAEGYIEVLLLTAEVWMGEDVTDAALALADRMHADGLELNELRALHLAALSRGANVDGAVVSRAVALGDSIAAPIAEPLAAHVVELAAGHGRLTGVAPRLLSRHGVVVPTAETSAGLTAREREVATAAALGYSSKAIAARFGNSRRTIDTHLNRIYVKLGITGRDDIASAVDRLLR